MDAFSRILTQRPGSADPRVGWAIASAEGYVKAPTVSWQGAVQKMVLPVLVVAADGTITASNLAAARLLGKSPDPVGMALCDLLDFADYGSGADLGADVRARLARQAELDSFCVVRGLRGTDAGRLCRVLLSPLGDEGASLVIVEDLGRVADLLRLLERRAGRDSLTRLLNRESFMSRLDEIMEPGAAAAESALIYLDLDGFKAVNDDHGHLAGDGVLGDVAAVFRRFARDRDTLARIGGDEFALVLPGCPRSRAEEVARELRAALRAGSFTAAGQPVRIDVSVGIAMSDGSGSANAWLAAADAACYADKRARRREAERRSAAAEALSFESRFSHGGSSFRRNGVGGCRGPTSRPRCYSLFTRSNAGDRIGIPPIRVGLILPTEPLTCQVSIARTAVRAASRSRREG